MALYESHLVSVISCNHKCNIKKFPLKKKIKKNIKTNNVWPIYRSNVKKLDESLAQIITIINVSLALQRNIFKLSTFTKITKNFK